MFCMADNGLGWAAAPLKRRRLRRFAAFGSCAGVPTFGLITAEG